MRSGAKIPTVLEWHLQKAAVTRLRHMQEYGKLFLLAGDMNAGRRGIRTATIAKATGITAGEPDLRIYVIGGRLGMIEVKVRGRYLSPEQKRRHADLRALGFDDIETLTSSDEQDAADQAEAIVRAWLPANDNKRRNKRKAA